MPDETPITEPDQTSRASDDVFDETADDITVVAQKINIVFYDDDQTPVDFVLAALENVLGYDEPVARQIVQKLGVEGKVVAARLQLAAAEQSAKRITSQAKASGFPFRVELTD